MPACVTRDITVNVPDLFKGQEKLAPAKERPRVSITSGKVHLAIQRSLHRSARVQAKKTNRLEMPDSLVA